MKRSISRHFIENSNGFISLIEVFPSLKMETNEKHYFIIVFKTTVLALKILQKSNNIAKSKLCWSLRIVRSERKESL